MRRFLLTAAGAVVGVIALLAVNVPAADATVAGKVCERHHHNSTEYADWCASFEFGLSYQVRADAKIVANHSTVHVQINDILLIAEYDGADHIVSTCVGDGYCPKNNQNGSVSSSTGWHGPCRASQDYFSVMRGNVRWSDGQLSTEVQVVSTPVHGYNYGCA
jgi:hypothetical protein